ncbi:zf-DHHC-domain-containing protein [Dothidotthia symphoricarpi CBS 119687]|uniref:Palmitoyltransferase n=1 Tax=Dothidotthia symphoricarpi CBS 119687 TaxID=1392245 RepID=A0A6A5ZYS2_9PLEO|nr:zf-DHHC-domain-containing protein [Dothidotthia symphoricarpi CBS 119687]KAF2123927.1 zf-DHHC-domain-containing protein [Dothidotthia symphoricarpi CBS 119687]
MALARNLIIGAGTVSLITFVAFFGRLPAFRNTPIGFLHRLLVQHFPSALHQLDVKLTNGRITSGGSRLGNYLMHDKHPVVVVFFLGLVTACAAMLLPSFWSLLQLHHKLFAFILVPQPYVFLYLSAKKNNETYITTLNHTQQMRHYPYDRVLYHPGKSCSTCRFLKPARSKHCSICKTCVARMDHHCIWVNNCLGRGNYKWFLALLLSTTVLIAYGAYLAWYALTPKVILHYSKYEHFYRYKPSAGSDPNSIATYFNAKLHNLLQYSSIYLDAGGICGSGVGLLALLTWPLPLGLLVYHIFLIWAGMSTNESAKWADWRDDMAEGVVFLGHRRENTMQEHRSAMPSRVYSAHSSSSSSPMPTPPETPPDDEEPPTTWPLESRHILIRTRDGQAPKSLPDRVSSVVRDDGFERVWSLAAVENVYDLGFWDNLSEALLN